MNKKLNLKNDIIFKTFFTRKGNEKYLIDFLNALLKVEIKKIKIIGDASLEQLYKEEKGGRIDLQAELNDGIVVDIEMQVEDEKNIGKRVMYYAAKLLSKDTKRGTNYKNVKEVIVISILDYELLKFDEYISKTVTVLENHREYEIIKDLKWYFIELPKFRRANPNMEEKINQWLMFIDDYDKGGIEMVKEKNKTLKEAQIELYTLTGDEEIQRIQELRERWEMDEISKLDYAEEKGIQKRNTKKKYTNS